MEFDDKIKRLKEIIDGSDNIVFFGGAGVSTESGIPDFRSTDGLYNQQYAYPPEEILSRSFFDRNPSEFFRFYRDKLICRDARPNAAHLKLAELERKGKLSAVVTQNIDGLHTAAGSRNVFELHGSILRNRCMKCGKSYPLEAIEEAPDVPRCSCGGIIKPDVVLYEEPLSEPVIYGAINAIKAADLLIIGGTSLAVWPAAGFIDYFQGDDLVIINRDETPADRKATLVIHGKIGETLAAIDV